jgi:SIR2-like domain
MELAAESRYPPYQVILGRPNPDDAEAQEQFFKAKLDCENLMLVSSWVEHGTGDRPRLRDKLRRRLASEENPLPWNPLHALLARIGEHKPMAIITTNYDDLVERAFFDRGVPLDLFVVAIDRRTRQARAQDARIRGSAGEDEITPESGSRQSSSEEHIQGEILFRPAGGRELRPVTGEQQLLEVDSDTGEIRLKRSVLFKIHGHINRARRTDDTFVITEEDYVSFLGRMASGNSVIPADLVPLMQSRRLLFLGYGLRDWNFRVLLDRLTRIRVQAVRSYAITYDIDPAESRLWDQRNVQVFGADLNEFVPRLDAEVGP